MAPSWREYRFWLWLSFALFFGFIPGMGAIAFLLYAIFPSDIPIFLAFLVWASVTCYASYRAVSFPCPRCGKRFFPVHQFARKCPYCGLPKWAEPDR